MALDNSNMVIKIETGLETRLYQCFPYLINDADLLPDHSDIQYC